MRPKILILDEPVAGLDPVGRHGVIRMIQEYRKTYNATVLIVSHNMENMAELADKLLVMNKGSVVMFDTTDNVFRQGDKLREIGLNVPIVTRVFDILKARGIDVPDDLFTVERAIKFLSSVKEGGESRA